METAESCLVAAEQELRAGHARAALEQVRAAMRTDPLSGRAWAMMGMAYTLMGDEVEAKRALDKALELAPLEPRIRYHCFLAFRHVRDVPNARAQLTYFCELDPKNAQAKAMLAQLGGPVAGLPPLPRPARSAVWYDGGGHATTEADDFDGDMSTDDAEPPAGPDVLECPDCSKRTYKGWFCKHCGATLPR